LVIDSRLGDNCYAKKLRRYPVNGRRRSLQQVANALAEAGYLSTARTPYTATAVSRMLGIGKDKHPTAPTDDRRSSSPQVEPAAPAKPGEPAAPAARPEHAAEPVDRAPLRSRW
jgi:hypothetical protein